MPRYSFPGYSVFVREAAMQIGHPEAEAAARGITALAALGNLCAQAGAADPAHAPSIRAKAEEFRDQLHAAFTAAGLMLSDVERALGFHEEGAEEKPAARPPRAQDSKGKKP